MFNSKKIKTLEEKMNDLELRISALEPLEGIIFARIKSIESLTGMLDKDCLSHYNIQFKKNQDKARLKAIEIIMTGDIKRKPIKYSVEHYITNEDEKLYIRQAGGTYFASFDEMQFPEHTAKELFTLAVAKLEEKGD